MAALEQLRKDHAVLRAKLALLENALTVGPEAAFAIRELVYSISRRLAEHEQRENVELYPVIYDTLAEPQSQFAKSLALEHEEHQYLLRALHLLTLKGLRMPMVKVACLAHELIESLREHIDREERLLFPVVERLAADRKANARAKQVASTGTAGGATMQEPMTINRILGMYPQAKEILACHCIDCEREGTDFLDEVAWRHAVPLEKLLRELRQGACPGCGQAKSCDHDMDELEEPEPFIFG